MPRLGEGIGWRPELALAIERRASLGFVELIAEDHLDADPPPAVQRLRERGVAVIPHAITLSLGGIEAVDARRLSRLARLAEKVAAPLVSDHVCFVRAGGLESGHLLPVPRTRAALDVLIDNVRFAQRSLPVPLALENIASLIEWPGDEMSESEFIATLLDETGALLLLDIENVYANARNHGWDALGYLDALPLDRIAYVHIAGGHERGGVWYDTHTSPVDSGALSLLEELSRRAELPGVMLERDDHFPAEAELHAELDAIAAAVRRGRCSHV